MRCSIRRDERGHSSGGSSSCSKQLSVSGCARGVGGGDYPFVVDEAALDRRKQWEWNSERHGRIDLHAFAAGQEL